MYWDVVEVKIKSHLVLFVRFEDGTSGIVRFLPTCLRGVFEPLKKPDFFKKVTVHDGYVTWPGEIDIAPDAMHDELKNNGEWILE